MCSVSNGGSEAGTFLFSDAKRLALVVAWLVAEELASALCFFVGKDSFLLAMPIMSLMPAAAQSPPAVAQIFAKLAARRAFAASSAAAAALW